MLGFKRGRHRYRLGARLSFALVEFAFRSFLEEI